MKEKEDKGLKHKQIFSVECCSSAIADLSAECNLDLQHSAFFIYFFLLEDNNFKIERKTGLPLLKLN
uniref:Uncharacterized protein n=1 Tax=Nelumbo nucifera TaxID=4432 RepID=A0A822YPT2_NELNU|nr:TPA_asm: hypothetical protein HUJ06_011886 [Nelumbo nucifera]